MVNIRNSIVVTDSAGNVELEVRIDTDGDLRLMVDDWNHYVFQEDVVSFVEALNELIYRIE